jgi:hypothetical protein
MTTAEFSAELDTIYENINKNGAPGLDGYERSVILTHAQELLVKESLKLDPSASQFPQLIDTYTTSSPSVATGYSWGTIFPAVSTGGKGLIKMLNEVVIDTVANPDVTYTVIPITQAEFDNKQITPYKYPPRRRAWRIGELTSAGADTVEIFGRPGTTLGTYKVRYVRKPKPIIIEDLQTLSPFALNVVSTYTVSTPGTGYVVGDILTLTVGTLKPTFRVMTVSAGTVLTVAMVTNGYGLTGGANATTSVPSSGRSGCQITITVANASTIDGEYLPQTSELDKGVHRDILKIASGLAEQYYYDKYGTDRDK